MKKKLTYINNEGSWSLQINDDNKVVVTKNDESREYIIPESIISVEQKDEYVFIYVRNGMYPNKFYQFKFEQDNFIVGDTFYGDGKHLSSFACHVFGEV